MWRSRPTRYAKLHDAVVRKFAAMEGLNKAVKELSQGLLSEKIKLERLNISKLEEDAITTQLFAEKEAAKLSYQNAQEENSNVQFAQKESIQEKNMIERRVASMREENKRMVEPQRKQYEKEIAQLEAELKCVPCVCACATQLVGDATQTRCVDGHAVM